MVTAVLFEIVGAALALSATSGGILGVLRGCAKDRAIAEVGTSISGSDAEVKAANAGNAIGANASGPYRTPPAAEPSDKKRRKTGKLLQHDYDLMIGRTFFR